MTDTTTPKPTQAEIEALVALLQRPHGNLTGGERQDVATALTAALDEIERLRNPPEEYCAKCGHPKSNHPYRHPFVATKGVVQ